MFGCTYCVDVLLAGFCPDARHLWSRCQKAFQKDHHHYHQTQKNLVTLINKISSLAMLVVVREEIKISSLTTTNIASDEILLIKVTRFFCV